MILSFLVISSVFISMLLTCEFRIIFVYSGSHDILANEWKLEFQGSSQTRFKMSYTCHKWNNVYYLCLLVYVN